jgi:hypothetical protein
MFRIDLNPSMLGLLNGNSPCNLFMIQTYQALGVNVK